MQSEDFAKNLLTLCKSYRSISEVCRLTGVNRQQFGRYLNGTYRPSRHNLWLICDALGVQESDLMLPAADFKTLFDSKALGVHRSKGASWLRKYPEIPVTSSDPSLRKYLGWYHSYSYSFGWPNWVIRSLVSVHEHQGRVVSKRIERVRDPIYGERFVYKFDGTVSLNSERLFIIEKDSLLNSGFTLKVLFCTHRSHVNFLMGLVTGTSMRTDNIPTSARVMLEYLGRTVDAKAELRKCGMFIPSRHNINPKILSAIDNTFGDGETALHGIAR
jgi:transcriptional regulator with XRE-family HTH domain